MQSPFLTNLTDISEDLRERALKRLGETLGKIDKVRRSLELPVEQLPLVIEIYNQSVAALIAEEHVKQISERTERLPLTLRSETRDYEPMKIKPGQTANVVVRPLYGVFRPEDLAIHGDRTHWTVHDIKIGNRSQFLSKRGPAAGTEFGPGGICEHLRLETAQTAMDITLEVEYVGPKAEGEVFEATMVGTAVR